MNETNNTDLKHMSDDATKWRELTILLQQKAYGQMSPREISDHLPDLRRIYRAMRKAESHTPDQKQPRQ